MAAVVAFLCSFGQQPGHQSKNEHPQLTIQECTAPGQCTSQQRSITLDGNWMWTHSVGNSKNCYTGDEWDKTLCPDPVTCAKNCALDASSYSGTYGVTSTGTGVSLKFVTHGQYGSNVGSRLFLLNGDEYHQFKLKNREFTFDVDVSTLPCGLNGALYFVEMDADGGTSRYPGNAAGAKYGTGYCDAQCPHDIKFISGEANTLDWDPSSANSGTGRYGTCCIEMDIWESNSQAQAVTPHPCTVQGQHRCNGTECGGSGKLRYEGVCDADGGDFNPYRFGDKTFYGKGPSFAVDSSKPMTVVTQFRTGDGTDTGDVTEIRRLFVQDGKVIPTRPVKVGDKEFDSITTAFVDAQKAEFGDPNSFEQKGGMKAVSGALERGVTLVMSLWDDYAVSMLWLDSNYPTTEPATKPGVARGPCPITSGKPADVEKNFPDATVTYSNIKYGAIGSTYPSGPAPPSPPSPSPGPPPSPGPSPPPAPGCPGGSLDKCMDLCPSTPPAAFKACVADCVKRCSSTHHEEII